MNVPTQHTLETDYPVGPVHCYSLELKDQLLLFDTGPPTEAAKAYLQNHLDLRRLKAVLLTHCHIDHYGLAAWLEQEYDATIYLPYRDSLKFTRHRERLDGMTELLGEIGFDRQFQSDFRADMDEDSIFPDLPQRYKIVENELPAELGIQILSCPGHSQSDLVYVGENWAVSGDTMLRGIFQSPLLDVDLLTGQRFSNYRAYCETIVKLATLRDKQILPGHREYIHGVDYNICFYTGKLLERAARCRTFPDGMSVAQMVAELFGSSLEQPFPIYLKASEIVLLRDLLAAPHHLQAALEQIGLYAQLAEKFEQAIGA